MAQTQGPQVPEVPRLPVRPPVEDFDVSQRTVDGYPFERLRVRGARPASEHDRIVLPAIALVSIVLTVGVLVAGLSSEDLRHFTDIVGPRWIWAAAALAALGLLEWRARRTKRAPDQ